MVDRPRVGRHGGDRKARPDRAVLRATRARCRPIAHASPPRRARSRALGRAPTHLPECVLEGQPGIRSAGNVDSRRRWKSGVAGSTLTWRCCVTVGASCAEWGECEPHAAGHGVASTGALTEAIPLADPPDERMDRLGIATGI